MSFMKDTMRHAFRAILAFCLAGIPGSSRAEDPVVKATAGRPVQVGHYSVLRNDCSGGAVPKFKMAGKPKHGTIVVQSATLKTKRLVKCGIVEAPALVVIYQSQADYAGFDTVSFAIVNPETGQGEPHAVSIFVVSARTSL